MIVGQTYLYDCWTGDGRDVPEYKRFTYTGDILGPLNNVPEVALPALAEVAAAEYRAPVFDMKLSPDESFKQLIGIPVWFWVTAPENEWRTLPVPRTQALTDGTYGVIEAEYRVGGLDGRGGIEFRPDVEGGTKSVFCDAPGVPYSPGAADDSTACKYTYWKVPAKGKTFHAQARLTYKVSWHVVGRPGLGGTLPDIYSQWRDFTVSVRGTEAVEK